MRGRVQSHSIAAACHINAPLNLGGVTGDHLLVTTEDNSNRLARHGYLLLQLGSALFLFSSFEGFLIPHFAVPRLGLSVHTLSAFEGVLLLLLGLVWPRLNLGLRTGSIAFWFLLYSTFA
jgi:(hydroxyamino)benzene mutase